MHLAARRAALSLLLVFAACRTGGVPAPAPSAAAAKDMTPLDGSELK